MGNTTRGQAIASICGRQTSTAEPSKTHADVVDECSYKGNSVAMSSTSDSLHTPAADLAAGPWNEATPATVCKQTDDVNKFQGEPCAEHRMDLAAGPQSNPAIFPETQLAVPLGQQTAFAISNTATPLQYEGNESCSGSDVTEPKVETFDAEFIARESDPDSLAPMEAWHAMEPKAQKEKWTPEEVSNSVNPECIAQVGLGPNREGSEFLNPEYTVQEAVETPVEVSETAEAMCIAQEAEVPPEEVSEILESECTLEPVEQECTLETSTSATSAQDLMPIDGQNEAPAVGSDMDGVTATPVSSAPSLRQEALMKNAASKVDMKEVTSFGATLFSAALSLGAAQESSSPSKSSSRQVAMLPPEGLSSTGLSPMRLSSKVVPLEGLLSAGLSPKVVPLQGLSSTGLSSTGLSSKMVPLEELSSTGLSSTLLSSKVVPLEGLSSTGPSSMGVSSKVVPLPGLS